MLSLLKSQLTEKINNLENLWDHKTHDPSSLLPLISQILAELPSFSDSEVRNLLLEIQNEKLASANLQKHNLHELPTKLVETKKFVTEIDIIKYNDPRVHGHEMLGGFKLIKGQGVQAIYEFDEVENFNDILSAGELIKVAEENLHQDSIVLMSSENPFIHNVVYFETPIVTLTIRTNETAFPMLYLPEGFRINIKKYDSELSKLTHDLKLKASTNALQSKMYDTETLIILNYLASSWCDLDETIRSYLFIEIAAHPWSNNFLSALTQNSIIHQST